MHVFESAVQVLGLNPIVAAVVGYAAQRGIGSVLAGWQYAPLFGRLTAAVVWGCGGVASLTVVGVPAAVTVPVALTVLAVVVVMLALAFAGGLIRPARDIAPLPVGT